MWGTTRKASAADAPMVGHIKTIVLGGGVGGMFVSKELHQHGEDFLTFDAMPRPGGVYVRYSYPDMHFTTSTQTAAFGDFPWKHKPAHWSIPEFVEYLDQYIDHFGFASHLRMNAKIETARRIEGGDKWEITVHFKKWHAHFSHEGKEVDVPERFEKYTCDHLVIATGTHNAWQYPEYEGLADFQGKYYHSSMFHDVKDELADKEVVLVGTGESGCDLANLAAKVCRQVHVSVRQHSGVYFPREFEAVPADTVDCHLLYCMARKPTHKSLGDRFYKRFVDHSYDKELFKMAGEVNRDSDRSALNSYGVKTFDLFNAVQKYDAKIHPGISKFEKNAVVFTDGTKLSPDAVMFSTGYCLGFSFFDEHEAELSCRLKDIRTLWKHCVVPELGDKLFVIGFARPNMASLFIPAELQARMVAGVIHKQVALPSPERMISQAKLEAERNIQIFSEATTCRLKALVDHLHYTDELAEYLGAAPPFLRAFFTDMELFVHLMFGSVNAALYRFSGPNSDYAAAAAAVKNIPLHRNYVRATLKIHIISVNVGIPTMLLLGPLWPSYRPVGTLRHLMPVFWGLLALVTAAHALHDYMHLGVQGIDPLWCLVNSLVKCCLTYFVIANSLVGFAWYYSPKPCPPGIRMDDLKE